MYIHIIICVYIYMIIIYTWILLIVEISTPKPKSINFAKFKRKRAPERLFPLQNVFFHSRTPPNGFECFFFTLLERVFPLKEPPTCLERQKPPLRCSYVFFFHIKPQNPSFIGGVKKNQYWEVPGVYIYIFYNTILYIYILYTYNDTHGYEFLRFIW